MTRPTTWITRTALTRCGGEGTLTEIVTIAHEVVEETDPALVGDERRRFKNSISSALTKGAEFHSLGGGRWRLSAEPGFPKTEAQRRTAAFPFKPFGMPPRTLTPLDTVEDIDLFGLYGSVVAELKRRKLVRSANVVGDYAEQLVARALPAELVPNSVKAYDLLQDGRRIQVKSRVLSDVRDPGQRQLNVIRSWGPIDSPDRAPMFDLLAVILFDDVLRVHAAYLVPESVAYAHRGAFREHVRGHIVHARAAFLTAPGVIDITESVRAVAV